ncbi:MAG: beta-lactamase family protein [Acidobacteriia bacterium]|nr:beta-lactamase family protein [Terriglobia bacterium]
MPAQRIRRAIARIVCTALLLSSAAARAQQKPPQQEGLPHPKTLEELQNAFKNVIEKNHVPGAGVALIARGELLWCGGIGKADLASGHDVTCHTEFRAGSVSKTFVALGLMKLAEQGRLNLYARLQDVAPELPLENRWGETHPVRIVNLLEHTAGFDDMRFSEIYNRNDPPDFPLLDVFRRFPGPQKTRWAPGTRFSYSNPGYGAAGYVIEKITGQPFDAYIQKEILEPIGITHGDFRLGDGNRGLLAQGYEHNPPVPAPYKNIYLRPAGDLKASPEELAKLVQFFLRRGIAGTTPLLKPESIGRMEYPETPSSARHGLRLGYGLGNYTAAEGGVVTHGHDGGIDGFISTYRYMPEQNWGYVILLNSAASPQTLREMNRLAIDFLSKDFPKPQQPLAEVPAEELRKLEGYYTPAAPRMQLLAFLGTLAGGVQVRLENGRLVRKKIFGGKKETLLPLGNGLFRGETEPEATSVFFTDENGKIVSADAGISGLSYAQRGDISGLYTTLALLAVCAALLASSLLFALVWAPLWALGKMKEARHLRVRAVPIAAILALAAAFAAGAMAMPTIGELDSWSLLVCAGTLLFALLSFYGLWLALRVPREEMHPAVRIHSLLVSGACCALTLLLSSWGLIGLRLWAS